jgi:tRNA-dihydrouridine synthase
MRLGWDDDARNYLQVAKIIEECGGQMLAVHGRTKRQGYSGKADWDAIAEVKQAVKIPVIANGDVRIAADIERIIARTGCDAVMIGRAAIGNPWIFSRRELTAVSLREAREELLDLFSQMILFYGEERGVLLFRKFSKRILLGLGVPPEMVNQVITNPDAERVRISLEMLLQPHFTRPGVGRLSGIN